MSDKPAGGDMATFSNYLKAAGTFAFLVTIFMAGFGLASTNWSSSLTAVQIDYRHAQDQLSTAQQELIQLKTQSAVCKEPAIAQTAQGNTEPNRAPVPGPPASGKSPTVVTTSIRQGASATIFGGDVVISVVGISFEGSPLRYRVSASVGSAGHKNVEVSKQDVGYAVAFSGQHSYEIRLMATDGLNAEFMVTQLSK